MCKYHKITKLSITIISLASLVSNFLFPHIALANYVGKNNILTFNFSEATAVAPLVSEKNTISPVEIINILPIEPAIEKNPKTEKIIISILAKKITAEVAAVPEEEQNRIAEKICAEAGITNLPCWQDLKVMREKESYGGKIMTGDGGRSRGWYHIQIKMHEVSDECALDFECSTEWTVKNLIANGYETNRFYAISRHNGSGPMAQAYAKNVVYLASQIEQ